MGKPIIDDGWWAPIEPLPPPAKPAWETARGGPGRACAQSEAIRHMGRQGSGSARLTAPSCLAVNAKRLIWYTRTWPCIRRNAHQRHHWHSTQ